MKRIQSLLILKSAIEAADNYDVAIVCLGELPQLKDQVISIPWICK